MLQPLQLVVQQQQQMLIHTGCNDWHMQSGCLERNSLGQCQLLRAPF